MIEGGRGKEPRRSDSNLVNKNLCRDVDALETRELLAWPGRAPASARQVEAASRRVGVGGVARPAQDELAELEQL